MHSHTWPKSRPFQCFDPVVGTRNLELELDGHVYGQGLPDCNTDLSFIKSTSRIFKFGNMSVITFCAEFKERLCGRFEYLVAISNLHSCEDNLNSTLIICAQMTPTKTAKQFI